MNREKFIRTNGLGLLCLLCLCRIGTTRHYSSASGQFGTHDITRRSFGRCGSVTGRGGAVALSAFSILPHVGVVERPAWHEQSIVSRPIAYLLRGDLHRIARLRVGNPVSLYDYFIIIHPIYYRISLFLLYTLQAMTSLPPLEGQTAFFTPIDI